MTIPQVRTEEIPERTPELDRLRSVVEASATLLTSLGAEQVLPRILDLAQQSVAADAYALWLVDPDTNRWRIGLSHGLSDEYVVASQAAIGGSGGQPPLRQAARRAGPAR